MIYDQLIPPLAGERWDGDLAHGDTASKTPRMKEHLYANFIAALLSASALTACTHFPKDPTMNGNSTTTSVNPANDGSHDFDFYMGHWRIQNKRLVKRLAGSTEWETFEAFAHARPLPGSIGNYDDFIAIKWRPDFVGMSFRVFSPITKKWSIYWLDNKTGGLDAKGHLTVPVVGEFKDGIGIFMCDDEFEGKPITVRYTWSNISKNTARWEQAFSPDGGKTWETNWVMDQTRIAE